MKSPGGCFIQKLTNAACQVQQAGQCAGRHPSAINLHDGHAHIVLGIVYFLTLQGANHIQLIAGGDLNGLQLLSQLQAGLDQILCLGLAQAQVVSQIFPVAGICIVDELFQIVDNGLCSGTDGISVILQIVLIQLSL